MRKQKHTGNFTLAIFVNSCNKMLRSIQSRILYLVQCPKSRWNRHAGQHIMSKETFKTIRLNVIYYVKYLNIKPIFTHLWEPNMPWNVTFMIIKAYVFDQHICIFYSFVNFFNTICTHKNNKTKTFFWHLNKRQFWFVLSFPKNTNKSGQYCITKILTI